MSLLRPQCPSNKNVSEAPSWPAVTNLSIAEANRMVSPWQEEQFNARGHSNK